MKKGGTPARQDRGKKGRVGRREGGRKEGTKGRRKEQMKEGRKVGGKEGSLYKDNFIICWLQSLLYIQLFQNLQQNIHQINTFQIAVFLLTYLIVMIT